VEAFKSVRLAAKTNGVDKTIADFDLDVIVGPMDGRIQPLRQRLDVLLALFPLGTLPQMGDPMDLQLLSPQGRKERCSNS